MWVAARRDAAQRRSRAEKARAAGFVPPVPWIKARRDLIPASRPNQRTLALEAAQKIRAPDPEWRLFEYIQFGECLIAAGFNHGACDYYEYYLSRTTSRSQRHVDSAALPVAALTAGPVRQGDRAHDAGRGGGRAIVYSRTGQYELAEQVLATERRASFYFDQFYLYLLAARAGEGQGLLPRTPSPPTSNRSITTGFVPARRLRSGHGLSRGRRRSRRTPRRLSLEHRRGRSRGQRSGRSEQHPRYQALLKRFGIDPAWCDELLAMANDLSCDHRHPRATRRRLLKRAPSTQAVRGRAAVSDA